MTIPLSGFSVGNLPRIYFGEGELDSLPQLISEFGRKILLLCGKQAFLGTGHWHRLKDEFEQEGIECGIETVSGEPSPRLVDEIVQRHKEEGIEAVVGIGGGSVLDAAKAVAGMLPFGNSVLDHLEDVGRGLPYEGPALPFIAVPTTAGTGSEATKNAVLSEHGANGYKKSFRHDTLVARVAVIDPRLLESCPARLIASQGMDAFTQLLESYVSKRANPFTDALAWSGLQAVAEGILAAYEGGDDEAARRGRAAMAYGALISGITLAHVGLGSVHGLAQPLGSLFPLPHGIACGTTLAAATQVNIEAMRKREPNNPALMKYAQTGRLLSGESRLDEREACDVLVERLESWAVQMKLPRLGEYGITEADIPRIVAQSRGNSMKSNPILLSDEEIAAIIRRRL